jgi:hypothetical protein
MNILQTISIGLIAASIAACSATPSKPAAPIAPPVTDISGKWLLTVQSPMGAVEGDMVVIQTDRAIKGTIDSKMGNIDITGSVNGKEVKFTYSVEKLGAPAGTNFDYTGTVDGGAMKGSATFSTFGAGEWSARRP